MVGVALVGCGGMANWHAQQLKAIRNARVVALADPVAERVERFKSEYFPKAELYTGLKPLLKNPPKGLDAVVLVTPHTMHYSQARSSLEAGLHVLVEKPMVTDSRHGYALWKAVKKSRRKLAIGFQSPYTPNFGWLAEQRDKGKLGRVELVGAWLSQAWKGGTKGTWRQKPELSGGGQMYDSGAHMLNAIMWLLNDSVVEVSCFYDRCGTPVDINGVATMRFQKGTIASVSIGGNCPHFDTQIHLSSDKYHVVTDQYGGKLEVTGPDSKTVTPKVKQPRGKAAGTPHANFIAAILGKEKLRSTVRHGVMLSALMDALYKSADTGKIVKVKPVPKSIK